jgi:hypothetical protein
MALALNTSSALLFGLNYFAAFPQDYIEGIAVGLGIAGLSLCAAGWKLGRRKD